MRNITRRDRAGTRFVARWEATSGPQSPSYWEEVVSEVFDATDRQAMRNAKLRFDEAVRERLRTNPEVVAEIPEYRDSVNLYCNPLSPIHPVASLVAGQIRELIDRGVQSTREVVKTVCRQVYSHCRAAVGLYTLDARQWEEYESNVYQDAEHQRMSPSQAEWRRLLILLEELYAVQPQFLSRAINFIARPPTVDTTIRNPVLREQRTTPIIFQRPVGPEFATLFNGQPLRWPGNALNTAPYEVPEPVPTTMPATGMNNEQAQEFFRIQALGQQIHVGPPPATTFDDPLDAAIGAGPVTTWGTQAETAPPVEGAQENTPEANPPQEVPF